MQAVLADWRTAPIPETVRAVLVFLEKLSLTPESVGPADVAALREAGLSDEAIEDAIHACAAFQVINRLADALGFELLTDKGYHSIAKKLLMVGYGI